MLFVMIPADSKGLARVQPVPAGRATSSQLYRRPNLLRRASCASMRAPVPDEPPEGAAGAPPAAFGRVGSAWTRGVSVEASVKINSKLTSLRGLIWACFGRLGANFNLP